MNKQEAIEKVKEHGEFYSNAFGGTVKMVPVGHIIDIIYEIHEPQKVVVPKFVAEWIESVKSVDWSFKVALNNPTDSVGEWLANRDNQETFARAWLFGFEIEQEKLYTVEIPDPNSRYTYRFLSKNDRGVFINGSCDDCWKDYDSNQLTEAEIKQDFDWAWQFAKEVE